MKNPILPQMNFSIKSTLFSLLFLCAATLVFAGGPKYQKAMGEQMAKFGAAQTFEDMQAASNGFARIAQAETEEWHPLYYQVLSGTIASFMNPEPAKNDEILDGLKPALDKLIAMQANNTEVYSLESMWLTAKLVVDPMTRGQKYSALSTGAANKAVALDDKNPRALYTLISVEQGTAQWFGKDMQPYCDRAQAVLDTFDSYKTDDVFAPKWGKDELKRIAGSCKK